MNKKQLIDHTAKQMETTKAEAERAINGVIEALGNAILKDGVVQLIGFGCFKVKKRKARKGRNPKTGEQLKIKAYKTVVFKPGKAMKDKLAEL